MQDYKPLRAGVFGATRATWHKLYRAARLDAARRQDYMTFVRMFPGLLPNFYTAAVDATRRANTLAEHPPSTRLRARLWMRRRTQQPFLPDATAWDTLPLDVQRCVEAYDAHYMDTLTLTPPPRFHLPDIRREP